MSVRSLVVASCLVAVAAAPAAAKFRWKPEQVPVDRLVRNVEKQLDAVPDSARVHYVLGRIHAIAFAGGETNIYVERSGRAYGGGTPSVVVTDPERGAWATSEEPVLSPAASVLVQRGGGPVDAARTAHLRKAIFHYRRATELGPDTAVHFLGYAWLLDSSADLAPKLGWPEGDAAGPEVPAEERAKLAAAAAQIAADDPKTRDAAVETLRQAGGRALGALVPLLTAKDAKVAEAAAPLVAWAWRDMALAAYRRALEIAAPTDRVKIAAGPELNSLVSAEAAESIVRLLDLRPQTDAVRAERAVAQRIADEMKKKPQRVTPVIFAAVAGRALRDVAPRDRAARFDLDGDGADEIWEWLGPDAAVLVWRPAPFAPPSTGRRLFGARTWDVLWRDGYEPLAALDDDGDGRLSGDELEGIAVWRDADGDAREDAGEVVSAAEFGVTSVSTRPDGTDDGVLTHSAGVRFADGTTRPTWDWESRRIDPANP